MQDFPPEEKKDHKKVLIFFAGFGVALTIFTIIGLLDRAGLLDKILDFLGIS